jgi:Na+/H+ antiporter NhaA
MQSEGADEGTAAFSTPTVLHFAAALLVSALLLAPWPSLIDAGVAAALVGLAGVANLARAMARTRRLSNYTADLEDWIWYTILPLVAYAAILAGGIAVRSGAAAAFAVAGGVVLLIFIGIRNAWDIVTFLTVRGGGSRDADDRPSGSAG